MSRQLKQTRRGVSRRDFLKRAGGAALAAGFPTIVPSTVFGANAPGNRITVGCIGVGRMGMGDLRDFIGRDGVQVVAVCDVDANRVAKAKQFVEDHYGKKSGSGYKGCDGYNEFEAIVERDDIDVVSIVTPDHWHIIPAIAAAESGKDIFLQKPLSLTIPEGRALCKAVKDNDRVFIVGSQQRSDKMFRQACELARTGRLGDLKGVKVGFGTDVTCDLQPEMPVPKGLDYDRWLGQAPEKPYTEMRVHPQNDYGRPGWLRIRDYGHGMITGWGAHHIDIAHWGLGTEHTGPVGIEGKGEYPDPETHLWDVHIGFDIDYTHANGIVVNVCDKNQQGVKFEGTDGWVQVKRGAIRAEPESLLEAEYEDNEERLYVRNDHKGNFLECVRTRKETVAPVEVAHRSCSACILGSLAMELGRKLHWDPDKEQFVDDDEANARLAWKKRAPWTL